MSGNTCVIDGMIFAIGGSSGWLSAGRGTVEVYEPDRSRLLQSAVSDLHALAACIRASRDKITPEELGTIKVPVLVAVGSKDVIGGSAQDLADLIPGAEALVIEDRDHMKAVGDRAYKDGVLAFLDHRP